MLLQFATDANIKLLFFFVFRNCMTVPIVQNFHY